MKLDKDITDIQKRLRKLAYNLWWSWNPRAQMIFKELSPLTWEISHHNPVTVLSQLSELELQARLGNRAFLQRVLAVLFSFEEYMGKKFSPQRYRLGIKKDESVAYFCAEFGIHECLPFYSGGLGVLAGDHMKSASDLCLPLVGVGLFYRQGYFEQHMESGGIQQENYPTTDPSIVPVELVADKSGKAILCSVTIGHSLVYFQGWRVNVGRCDVYLLDTNVPENEDHFRGLTALAYGGDINTRIQQEIILGIGGVRFLRTLGIKPSVFHMNEGHAAFLTLELLLEQLQSGLTIKESEGAVRNQCVFTTHTPVAAGHDRFPADLIEFTLRSYADQMKISIKDLMEYGRIPESDERGEFTMTILGLKLSRSANGVSKKHGEVSRKMWRALYQQEDEKRIPIGYITNGVHLPSWTSSRSWEFWERHNSHQWKEHLSDVKFWKHVSDPAIVSDEELWALRYELRRDLIEYIREQSRHHHVFGGVNGEEAIHQLFSFDALTIGFARRFAPYKRAPLIFSNIKKALELFNNSQRPVQIIFAGKAHPRDGEGKEFLRKIIEITRQHPFYSKVVFIENYNMDVARYLVSGCDVWLNTPRRPMEASGTSGQKIAINCGLHFSILDGWWAEAYNGKNGWAIGKNSDEQLSPEEVDYSDADSLYHMLENEIIPLFYDRNRDGIPHKWIKRIRNSMQTIIPIYNTHRMVVEYVKKYYFPKRNG